MPIFRVKSVKIYTGQKNLHGHRPRVRDKYEVWEYRVIAEIFKTMAFFVDFALIH